MKFILHWKDKKTEEIDGKDIAEAFTKAGYSAGAITALDYYEMVQGPQDLLTFDPVLYL